MLSRVMRSGGGQLPKRVTHVPRARVQHVTRRAGAERTSYFCGRLGGPKLSVVKRFGGTSPDLKAVADGVSLVRHVDRCGTSISTVSYLARRSRFRKGITCLGRVQTGSDLPVLQGSFVVYRCRFCRTGIVNTSTMLLVATVLSSTRVRSFCRLTKRLRLSILIRARSRTRIRQTVGVGPEVVKIGGHGLGSFAVSLRRAEQLHPCIPRSGMFITRDKVAKSRSIQFLQSYKISTFLVKHTFVRSRGPGTLTRG